MPKPLPLKLRGQRGSILVGVIGLSLVLTMAAAGYILTVGLAHAEEAENQKTTILYAAAESGLMMGADYVMRNWSATSMKAGSFAPTHNISGPTPSMYNWVDADDGARITVYLSKSSDTLRIISLARLDMPSDTVRLEWMIDSVENAAAPKFSRIVRLRLWKDKVLPL